MSLISMPKGDNEKWVSYEIGATAYMTFQMAFKKKNPDNYSVYKSFFSLQN